MIVTKDTRCDELLKAVGFPGKPKFLNPVAGLIWKDFGIEEDKHRYHALMGEAPMDGLTIDQIRRMAGNDYPVIRIMPNTPVSVGEGMVLYASVGVEEKELTEFACLMKEAGKLDYLPEGLIDAGCALSGCGPAFFCQFIEALADGAVECGLPRDKAMLYATQTAVGTAKLIQQSGQHPGALKDAVCSPGGSTIAGVHELEAGALRGTVMNAVSAAYQKTKDLGKEK